MGSTLELFAAPLPPGVRRFDEAVTEAEEASLLALGDRLDLAPYVMRGQASRRLIASFGGGYHAGPQRFSGPAMPEILLRVRDRIAAQAGLRAEAFAQVIYTVYPPGAGIGWHVDLPRFGPDILGLSLASPAALRFRRKTPRGPSMKVDLPPRSAYVIGGEARAEWEHHLPPVKALRVSLTFRTLREAA